MTGAAPRRSWFRFRLSWLLVLLTLAGVFLGRKTYLARNQADAVKVIMEAEGHIFYSYEVDPQGTHLSNPQNPYPAWIRTAIGEDYFRTPVVVDLATNNGRRKGTDKPKATPVETAALGKLRHLHTLGLGRNESVDDQSLAHLARLYDLRTLYLYHSEVTGIGFGPLAHLPIENAELSHSPVTDEGLEQIARLRRLKYPGLENTAITDDGIPHLASLPQLEELRLSYTNITDDAVASLAKMQKLKSMTLMATKVSREGVDRLAQALPNCEIHRQYTQGEVIDNELLFAQGEELTKKTIEEKLKSLGIDHDLRVDENRPDQPITSVYLDAGDLGPRPVLQLFQSMPELESLVIDNTFTGDEILAGLKECQHLRTVSLHGGLYTAAGLANLQQARSLREVELHQLGLSDDDVDDLIKLKQIESLFIQGSYFSPEGIEALRRGLPKCRITVH